MKSDTIRTLDLFAGAGGFSAGLHSASDRFVTVRAVELDVAAAASYRANFGDVVYTGGIENWLDEEDVPQVDLVVGGPPCQGFSPLGKRAEDDHRNFLWEKYAETVRRARPTYFLLENVPAFLRSPQFDVFSEALLDGGMLDEYEVEAFVLNSAHYGAAQIRKRVVVIGRRRGLPPVGAPSETHATDYVPLSKVWTGVPAELTQSELPDYVVRHEKKMLPGPFRSDELHLARTYSSTSLLRFAAIPEGGNRFDLPEELKAPCWRKHTSGSGDVMGRLTWTKPSVTIRTEFFKPEKGRYLHPTEHRAITHFEAARIQGFPDDYNFVGSKSAIAKQIGNAVPIPLGAALGRHLLTAIDRER
ncbi:MULTISPECIES: DNA cytosine methyltransferase [unclassified Rathayibacter]|uniref:DNA cytosine methyltransferase n=1 Tax=unclassified Rathayibacter TaxID=2609250 RepID=UPI0010455678|nr:MULTISPECIES: DNA cytosine methyltransferase [unclassified Rathayibacter]TCL80085.1 DNA (cytosine-5)-methyltransferase 1 [Rathayibacter sp. PhB192]TCM25526.1 DNA (cytosine-5)-methyltransferase 1 [Rathayibacter sp. PhB179]